MIGRLGGIPQIALALLLAGGIVCAQPAVDPAAALRQTAEKKTADWEALARALDNKIQRMLPCDSQIKQSIADVRTASDTRLAALTEVLRNAIVQAAAESQRVKEALSAEDGNLREANVEREDADQERIAFDAEASDLKDTAKQRSGFDEALKKIGEIEGLTGSRTDNANRQVEARALFSVALRDLLAADQKRQNALDAEQVALSAETVAWSQYYSLRIQRADVECSITGSAPRSNQRKKK